MIEEKPDIKPAVLRAANNAADAMVQKIYWFFSQHQVTSWDTLAEKMGNFDIPNGWRVKPWSYANLRLFCAWYKDTVADRIMSVEDNQRRIGVLGKANCRTYGEVTLFGEQQGTVNAIKEAFDADIRTALNIADTGAGKTVIGTALIHEFKQYLNKPRGAPIVIVTKKSIKETWRRHIKKMGLGEYLDSRIKVTTYSALTSSELKYYMFEEIEEDEDGRERTVYIANPLSAPDIVIADESQCVNRPTSKRAKFFAAWNQLGTIKFIYMSATPFVLPYDTRNFTIAAGLQWNGLTVTKDNFNQFIGSICADPYHANAEAMERYKRIAGKHIFITPRVKWDHHSYNAVRLCDFENDASLMRYLRAQENYLEFCRQAGKNTNFGSFEKLVRFIQMCQAVEPERLYQVCQWVIEALERKKYALMFMRTRNAVIQSVLRLTKAGVPRDKISIVWGGNDEIKKDFVIDKAEIIRISQKLLGGERLTPKERRCLKMTALANVDQARYQDADRSQQWDRYEIMRELGLYDKQSEEDRQVQVDRFNEGDTWVLVGTIASGGTGLSLDHSSWASRQRESFITPVYSAHEFLQAFGRGLRRTTKSDIYQWACLMRGTIEEQHVAPLLDEKLAALRKLTSFDIIDLLEEMSVAMASGGVKRIRSVDEVKAQEDADENLGPAFNIEGPDKEDEDDDDADDND